MLDLEDILRIMKGAIEKNTDMDMDKAAEKSAAHFCKATQVVDELIHSSEPIEVKLATMFTILSMMMDVTAAHFICRNPFISLDENQKRFKEMLGVQFMKTMDFKGPLTEKFVNEIQEIKLAAAPVGGEA